MLTPEDVAYLQSQPLARFATVSPDGQPDVSPVTFQFDGSHLYVGGFDISRTFKYKNVVAGNPKVSLVIDDLASTQPWAPRSVKIHGTAEVTKGPGGKAMLKITPLRSWSMGIHDMGGSGVPKSRKGYAATQSD